MNYDEHLGKKVRNIKIVRIIIGFLFVLGGIAGIIEKIDLFGGNTKDDAMYKKLNHSSGTMDSSYYVGYGDSAYSTPESSESYSAQSHYGASQTQKSTVNADVWYICTTVNALYVQNCEISSAGLFKSNNVMVNYFPVCRSCHAVSEDLNINSVSPNYPIVKSYYCDKCGAVTTVKLKVEV